MHGVTGACEGEQQAALDDLCAGQAFRKVGFHRFDGYSGRPLQGFDIGLGREVGVEEGDVLFGQGLRLLLGEAASR